MTRKNWKEHPSKTVLILTNIKNKSRQILKKAIPKLGIAAEEPLGLLGR